MTQHRKKSSLSALLAIALLVGAGASAATIETSAHKGFGRINFNFDQPAKLRMSTEASTTAVLHFDEPLQQSPAAIKAGLPGYVTNASLSADKKTLTLNLAKAYRVRQFVSGSSVGVDIVGEAATTGAAVSPPPAKEAPEDLSKPAGTIPAAKPAAALKAPPAAKPAPKTATAVKPAAAKAEPKKPEPKPAAEKPKPVVPTPVAKPDPMLTTKKPATAKPEALPESKKPEVSAAEKKPAAPTADDDVEAAADKKPDTREETTPAAPPKAPAAAKPVKPGKNIPFAVGTRVVNGETVLNFPWSERTGTAVFRRGNNLWVVFSTPQDINAPLLRTVMPKQVATVTQYAIKGATVMRLVTDGSINARAVQEEGSYGWNLILSPNSGKPLIETAVTSDALDNKMRLVLNVFDVAAPVKFYDPEIGDLLLVIPAYENGRGITNARSFPEFTILPSNQGITLASRVDDLTTNQTRAGFIISSKDGLAVSDNLPLLSGNQSAPVAGASGNSSVMLPYDQWYVPQDKFLDTLFERLQGIAEATKATKADSVMELTKLYLQDGQSAEGAGMLRVIATQFPDYYKTNKLALLTAVCELMLHHFDTANAALKSPELDNVDEANLWREVIALYAAPATTTQKVQAAADNAQQTAKSDAAANTSPPPPSQIPEAVPQPPPKPVFHFLKYNKPYIRFYPPHIRQFLAVIAADSYLADGQEEKALAVYDTLIHDGIMDPLKMNAEYTLGMVAVKKEQTDQAYEIFDRISKQTTNPYIAARARYQVALLRYKKGVITADQAIDQIQSARISWRGDALERQMLMSLIDLYKDKKQYDNVLRMQKTLLDAFPYDPDALTMSGEMSDLFASIFLDGLADDMPPLKALSLFYEFRELTPVGDKGDAIIQRLADRLAAFDLLDRATQLLEHQIKFRVSGAARSQVGARLALLHLLNHHPQEALSVLEVTNYGGNSPELQLQREQLTAEALTRLGKNDEALGILFNDTSKQGALLRLDILWAMQDWPNVVNRAEDILSERPNLTETLTPQETEVLLKLALGYAFEGDNTQLRYLRDYYSGLIPDTAYKQIFDFITNDTTPLDPEDFNMLAEQISRTQGFLETFKSKIAAGKLSEAVK